MALTQNQIAKTIVVFRKDVERAESLYRVLVEQGFTFNMETLQPQSLRQPDRRDTAQFIFFELAAKFEAFAQDMFRYEVRIRYDVAPSRANHIMGSSERGLQGVMGWASPKQLAGRGQNLFGKVGFFWRLYSVLGGTTYQYLALAHIVRNHIAHSGTKAYRKSLDALAVPEVSRQGCSPGRLLIEYPNQGRRDNWFYRFTKAYRAFTIACEAKLKIEEA